MAHSFTRYVLTIIMTICLILTAYGKKKPTSLEELEKKDSLGLVLILNTGVGDASAFKSEFLSVLPQQKSAMLFSVTPMLSFCENKLAPESFTQSNWSLFWFKNSPFYLLIPNKIGYGRLFNLNQQGDTDYAPIDVSNTLPTTNDTITFVNNLKTNTEQPNISVIKCLEKIFHLRLLSKETSEKSPPNLNIFITGHGSPDVIADLSLNDFQKLLSFFNQIHITSQVHINGIIINSCLSGGRNQTAITSVLNEKASLNQSFNFPIIIGSDETVMQSETTTKEKITINSDEEKIEKTYIARHDLEKVFSLMNQLRRDKESWENFGTYLAESQSFSANGLHLHLNVPKILWPGSTQFSFVDLKDWIKVFSWTNTQPKNIINKSRIMVVRPQYFDKELTISPYEIFFTTDKQNAKKRDYTIDHFVSTALAVWHAAPPIDVLILQTSNDSEKIPLIRDRVTKLYPIFIPYEPTRTCYFKKITAVDQTPKEENLPPKGVLSFLIETFLDVSSLLISPPIEKRSKKDLITIGKSLYLQETITTTPGKHEKRIILIDELTGKNDITDIAAAIALLGGSFNKDLKNNASSVDIILNHIKIECGGEKISRTNQGLGNIYGIRANISFVYQKSAWEMSFDLISEDLYTKMTNFADYVNKKLKEYKEKVQQKFKKAQEETVKTYNNLHIKEFDDFQNQANEKYNHLLQQEVKTYQNEFIKKHTNIRRQDVEKIKKEMTEYISQIKTKIEKQQDEEFEKKEKELSKKYQELAQKEFEKQATKIQQQYEKNAINAHKKQALYAYKQHINNVWNFMPKNLALHEKEFTDLKEKIKKGSEISHYGIAREGIGEEVKKAKPIKEEPEKEQKKITWIKRDVITESGKKETHWVKQSEDLVTALTHLKAKLLNLASSLKK